MSLVLGLEHSCCWPREGLSLEGLSLALASDFLCPWPWPRALCRRLHLCNLNLEGTQDCGSCTRSRIGQNPEWKKSRMDKIPNGQNPELDRIPNGQIPNGKNPEWTKSRIKPTSKIKSELKVYSLLAYKH